MIELLAWVAVGLCVAGVAWAVVDSLIEGKRVTDLEATLDAALRALDDAVVRISHLEDAATMPREADAPPVVAPERPKTAWGSTRMRTDTVEAHAVTERVGRHRAA